MGVVKTIEVIGTSQKSFDDAMKQGINKATKTLRNVSGVDIISHKLVIRDEKIAEYRVVMRIAFVVEPV